MYHVIRFIKGHLRISISGSSKERFLNLCRNHHIYLWDIQQDYETQNLHAYIHITDYFKILPILRKTETKAAVLHKYGLPFWIPFLQKKLFFLVGMLLLFLYLGIASSYIWTISIQGNHAVTDNEISDFLDANHFYIGMKKSEIPVDQLEMALRDSFPEITWTSIQIAGTHCLISIQENTHIASDQESEQDFTNLVADKEGQIVYMVTRKGVPKVAIGDQVEKGAILVEGTVPVFDEAGEVCGAQLYDADADIYVRTREHFTAQLAREYTVKQYTGRKTRQLHFQIHQLYIRMPISFPIKSMITELPEKGIQNPFQYPYFDHSSKQVERAQLRLFSEFYLPIYRSSVTEEEYVLETKEYSDSEMEMLLTEQVNKFILCLQEKGVQIIEKNVKIRKNIAVSEVSADFITIESLGTKETIQRE